MPDHPVLPTCCDSAAALGRVEALCETWRDDTKIRWVCLDTIASHVRAAIAGPTADVCRGNCPGCRGDSGVCEDTAAIAEDTPAVEGDRHESGNCPHYAADGTLKHITCGVILHEDDIAITLCAHGPEHPIHQQRPDTPPAGGICGDTPPVLPGGMTRVCELPAGHDGWHEAPQPGTEPMRWTAKWPYRHAFVEGCAIEGMCNHEIEPGRFCVQGRDGALHAPEVPR